MNLLDPVSTLKGIGPKTADTLGKAGIKTVRDFFYNLPRDYENYAAPTSISEIQPGKVVIRGKIADLSTRRARRRNLSVTEGIIRDKTGAIRVVWFNQSYRIKQFSPEKEYYFAGEYALKNGRYSLFSPQAAEVAEIDPHGGLSPIYVAHGRIRSGNFHKLVVNAKPKFREIPDLLPYATPGARREALYKAHFPENTREITRAREYLAYEELFELVLAAKLNRRENDKLQAPAVPFEAAKIREFVAALPFKLTNAQRRAAWEIFQDMERGTPMNRLLQGDVGSGKTMVAALAAYEAILQGYQVAILAPTALLAGQHYATLSAVLAPFGVQVALLTGATKGKTALKKQIAAGEVNLVVGTHALLTDDTEFKNLALVIIDEQHRFGVKQRQKLLLKSPAGLAPHFLAMTATPIPRSLQLTLFGDLSVSVLDELPKGRQPVATKIFSEIETRGAIYPKIQEVLATGQQVYWVCKAIEEEQASQRSFDKEEPSRGSFSEPVSLSRANPSLREGRARDPAQPAIVQKKTSAKAPHQVSELTSVKRRAAKLVQTFPKAKIEILHGKMKPAEKDAAMERFARGETQILVATTVVEVGVDVPNATLMVIENAESYGLAQLHQLRGRVGRGQAASFCYLVTSGDARPSQRLKELEKSNDGFHLAEVDLKLRGPGEIYGALQHGALDLRIASLSNTKLIHRAQQAVDKLLTNPKIMSEYTELMQNISKYQQITTLN